MSKRALVADDQSDAWLLEIGSDVMVGVLSGFLPKTKLGESRCLLRLLLVCRNFCDLMLPILRQKVRDLLELPTFLCREDAPAIKPFLQSSLVESDVVHDAVYYSIVLSFCCLLEQESKYIYHVTCLEKLPKLMPKDGILLETIVYNDDTHGVIPLLSVDGLTEEVLPNNQSLLMELYKDYRKSSFDVTLEELENHGENIRGLVYDNINPCVRKFLYVPTKHTNWINLVHNGYHILGNKTKSIRSKCFIYEYYAGGDGGHKKPSIGEISKAVYFYTNQAAHSKRFVNLVQNSCINK
jgi:hypothetical protein